MNKNKLILQTLVFILVLVFCCSCGEEDLTSKYVGKYELTRVLTTNGEVARTETWYDIKETTITLEENGLCRIVRGGGWIQEEEFDFEWTAKDYGVCIDDVILSYDESRDAFTVPVNNSDMKAVKQFIFERVE